MNKSSHISIWFFVGSLLTVYGVLILGADIWAQSHPPAQQVVLSEYRAGLWWGLFMLVFGLIYCIKFRPGKR